MYKKYIKRSIDLILSVMGLIPFIVILVPVSIIIYLEDRGPIFYNAPRLGQDGTVFKMFKFRSMKVNAPDLRKEDGSTFNSEQDPRLTRIGSFIRKTSIDEIPQILNVIRGDMSLIGPRPDLPEHINLYTGDDIRKLEVKPGITGYSQAYYRNSIEWKQRIKNDIYYIDNLNLWNDIKIFLKTIKGVLKSDSVYISDGKIDNGNDVEDDRDV